MIDEIPIPRRKKSSGTVPFFAAQEPIPPHSVTGEKGDCPPRATLARKSGKREDAKGRNRERHLASSVSDTGRCWSLVSRFRFFAFSWPLWAAILALLAAAGDCPLFRRAAADSAARGDRRKRGLSPSRYLWATTFALLAALPPGGCAPYRIGNASLYPTDVHTVYVPIFECSSFRRHLGERITEAVMKEIELKTPYKVTGDSNADTILVGRIVGDTKKVVVENRFDEPRELELGLKVQVSWLDRQRNLIRQCEPIPVPLDLVDITESSAVVPEVGQSIATGHQKTIQRLAQQIVAMMEAPW